MRFVGKVECMVPVLMGLLLSSCIQSPSSFGAEDESSENRDTSLCISGEEVKLGQQIVEGIDWAIAEATREESSFFEKLNTSRIAAMGYSMGALATFTIADDERLTSTVYISGGNQENERVKNLRAPAAFICGGVANTCTILSANCDIAAPKCGADFASAETPVFYTNFPGGHLGVLSQTEHRTSINAMAAA
jgi:dienelactone hydrolase